MAAAHAAAAAPERPPTPVEPSLRTLPMDLLRADDFALFGLPRRFALSSSELEARRRALQVEAHPDRHALDGALAQRRAMQLSARINDAYARLRRPATRAAVLCELAGVPIDAEANTAMPAGFLEQQMRWREALDDAEEGRDADAWSGLQGEVGAERAALLERIRVALDEAGDPRGAAALVRALMFVDRFEADLDERRAAAAG